MHGAADLLKGSTSEESISTATDRRNKLMNTTSR